MTKTSAKRLTITGIICLVCIIAVLVCDQFVSNNAKGQIYDDVESLPHRKVGLILGTSPISSWSGKRNLYFDYRIKAGAELYKADKVDWLVVSGGDYSNTENGYDEPIAMRDSLIKLGVDSSYIILDYGGTNTLNSIAKMRDVYCQDSIIIISQKYHNERALYLAKRIGIDAIGFNAKTPGNRTSWWRNRGREVLARIKMFVDLLIGRKPDIITRDFDSPDLFEPQVIIECYSNSVKGHVEKDTIVGNFTGNGIDTLYVSVKFDEKAEFEERVKYYAKSNNPALPTIELYGSLGNQPKLVYEGDVDGDGKDEWGYLHTWTMSQWRYYRVYNYDNRRKEWRYLFYDVGGVKESLLDTSEGVRSSGVDIVEKGPSPGLIKINYNSGYPKFEMRDTIVKPTYTRIPKDD